MSWQDDIRAYALERGRALLESDLGLGLEFSDGCAAFWMLPGEVMSTVPLPRDASFDPSWLLRTYETLDERRRQVLHALRHFLARNHMKVHRSRSGRWGVESPGGASSSLDVGDILTKFAAEHEDPYEVLLKTVEGGFIGGKPPSRRRFERHLMAEGDPPDEPAPPDHVDGEGAEPAGGDEDENEAAATIAAAIANWNACHAFDRALNLMGEGVRGEEARQRAESEPPVGLRAELTALLNRLAERLPEARANHDAFGNQMSISFTDGYGAFPVPLRGRELLRRVRKEGPAAAGDALVVEFLRLDDARRRTIAAIFRAAADRQWKLDSFGGGGLGALLGVPQTLMLGAAVREVRFEPGEPLTTLLRRGGPAEALRQVFPARPDFAEACIAALERVDEGPPVKPPEATLPEPPPGDVPALVELDASAIAKLDAFAQGVKRRLLRDEKVLWKYHDADFYDRERDTWVTRDDWLSVAEKALAERFVGPAAILILHDAGDPRVGGLVERFLRDSVPHHEVSDAEVEIAWRYRHLDRAKTREWFAPQPHESVPFAEVRARLGDPVAVRVRQSDPRDEDAEEDEQDPREMPPEEQAALRRRLLEEVRTTTRGAPPDVAPLRRALAMGWRDVAEAYADNPHLVAGLLTTRRRADQFDEPGALLASDLFLVWSRLDPSPWLARLIATVRETDLVALATEAAEASARRNPSVRSAVATSINAYRSWREQLDEALAIAWLRCRAAGVTA